MAEPLYNGITVVDLTAEQALAAWADIEPYVIEALSQDPYNQISVGALRNQVEQHLAAILVCSEGEKPLGVALIQRNRLANGGHIIHVLTAAGDEADKWLGPLRRYLVDIAKAQGAEAVHFTGRPGWTRKLKDLGFKVRQVSMRLDIE